MECSRGLNETLEPGCFSLRIVPSRIIMISQAKVVIVSYAVSCRFHHVPFADEREVNLFRPSIVLAINKKLRRGI
jgi:hypothetical protein